MEAVSLGLAVPGFINDGIELKQRFQAAKAFDAAADQAQKLLRSNMMRLNLWEEKTGLKNGQLQGHHHPALDDPVVLSSVEGHLDTVKELRTKIETALSKLQHGNPGKPQTPNSVPTLSSIKSAGAKRPSPFPSRSGIKWGFGRDKTVLGDLQNLDKHVDKIYQLVPPKSSEYR